MTLKETNKALNNFAKYVIQQSRTNLTKGKKNVTSDLYGSLGYDLKTHPNSFSLEFYMLDYGEFQDKGVSGTKRKYNTIYEYTNKRPPAEVFSKWAKAKGIRLRDEKGRFKKGSYKTLGFILANSVFEKGIKPSLFFTKPFEKAFDRLPDELIERFALDLDQFLDTTT